ncbi:MAG: hypothetical protein E7377_01355 [Clostridiales bacterium]|nr:hypothetical protein [Clostridiales bacterium]
MAIVKMRKLNLIAMSYDKDKILDALQRTNAAEITLHAEIADTIIPEGNREELSAYLHDTEATLQLLSSSIERYERNNNIKSDLLKDGFDVSYTEFVAAGSQKEAVDGLILRIKSLFDEQTRIKAELSAATRAQQSAKVYQGLEKPFSAFGDTLHTQGRLGVVPLSQKDGLLNALAETELCACEILFEREEGAVVYAVSHKSVAQKLDEILSLFGFIACQYNGAETGKTLYERLCAEEKSVFTALEQNERTVYALKDEIRLLKVYCDYLNFAFEKEEMSERLRATQKTVWLQAYVPEPSEKTVEEELKKTLDCVYMEFTDPTQEDTPPTLLKNNSIVSNFEGITNTYSAPHYREFDPNTVMAFFYSLFMGFIIGDAGYGLLMFLGGGYLWWKNRARPTGLSRLAGAFSVGGIFAIIWGILFNSLFGFMILPKTVMPNPQTDMWSLMGISVPSVLLIAMLIGVVQLFAGYMCRAVQEWRRGNIADGIFDGVTWAIFSVGVGLAIIGLIEEAKLPVFTTVGGVTAGASLLIAMITAGRKEKALGKLTKGFGAAYGIINYASDILSYARLYGLMLSGAVIAQIIAGYSGDFIVSGNVLLAVLGVVLLIVGNAFNLVMNLLGAYIHDARLQYVEFYGRFYEGDGDLFRPLGSQHKYIYLLPAMQEKSQNE